MRRPYLTLAAVLAFALPAPQQPAQFTLGPRTGTISEPYSDLMGMAELNDGRVIVSDRIEKSYTVADFKTGTRKTVGRNGTGPNEYQVPFGPIRWRGDTLLGHDPNNRRSLKIDQSGAVISTIPFAAPVTNGINSWGAARGVDSEGRVYWDAPIIEMEPVIKRSMKANIIRWLPGTDARDAVLQFADHAQWEHDFRFRAIPQTDAWVVTRDGRIGVLSAAEYRLRWYKDGKLVETGAPVKYTPVAVTGAERDAFRAKKALEPSAGVMVSGDPEARAAQTSVRVKATWPDSLFPRHLPPFEVNGALLAPNGDIWVKRTIPAKAPSARVDILDAHGNLRGTLALPPNTRLFSLGAVSVYLIATDDDGLQTLERYAYPSGL